MLLKRIEPRAVYLGKVEAFPDIGSARPQESALIEGAGHQDRRAYTPEYHRACPCKKTRLCGGLPSRLRSPLLPDAA